MSGSAMSGSGTASRSEPEAKALPLPESRDDDIFAQALALPATERPAFLASACTDDAARQTNLATMLAAHERAAAGNFMSATLVAPRRASEVAGDWLGAIGSLKKSAKAAAAAYFAPNSTSRSGVRWR